ncbi:glycosyltransferase, group 2 domain protein [Leptospira fainei serovar Hurstbridge str. BUT 6]|uniref:Glycosyltransferase, group 2 domain protein n=1 Tax=Leptospira fainei serovar Hurstbridge str. BUT 6 TaxID=1193011 RepID=S3V3R5_9LEPT|nr:glycosyltransferase family 2 protein [Leptospira fainei]EPG76023.1 glycosyltransferase, group 2 domain protein [Leptospira fainei serovar Hurstbridge str. BUT 6]
MTIITTVTPSFNQDKYIERTIRSVLSQEGEFYLDYIIMDGGSTDSSVAIIKKIEAIILSGQIVANIDGLNYYLPRKDNELSVGCLGLSYRWFSEKDKGQANAINKGWRLANGKILSWLNSDDIYVSGALATAVSAFSDSNIHFLYGGSLHITADDLVIEPYPSEPYDRERLFDYCYISQPSVFIRKEVFDQAGEINEKLAYCMDYEYWLRISMLYPLNFISRILACTRIHGETKTSFRLKVHSEILAMQNSLLGVVSEHWLYHYVGIWIKENIKNSIIKRKFVYRSIFVLVFLLLDFRFNYGRISINRFSTIVRGGSR